MTEQQSYKVGPNFEGIGYHGLHSWVRENKPKQVLCENCKQENILELSNISPTINKITYTKDFNNWRWLCRSCHMIIDKRMVKEKSPHWKGGLPKCSDCNAELSNYGKKKCIKCSNKMKNWKGGKPKCVDCNIILRNYDSIRCKSCAVKEIWRVKKNGSKLQEKISCEL